MVPLIAALIGAGTGAIQHNQDKAEFNRQKELAARVQQWSPWTGMTGAQYMPQKSPNLWSKMLQGAYAGGTMGMGGMGGMAGGMGGMGGEASMGGSPLGSSGGDDVMAGGYSQSPWQGMQRNPTFYG